MNFHAWETHYELSKQRIRKDRPDFDMSIHDYYKEYQKINHRKDYSNKEFEIKLVSSEVKWLNKGKPYYNLNPNIIEPAMRMKLDIPVALVDVPRDFSAVNLRFPDHPLSENIRSVLAVKSEEGIVLFYKVIALDGKFDYGAITFFKNISPNISLDEYLDKAADEANIGDFSRIGEKPIITAQTKKILKLYVTVKFLSDVPNDELIEYDVISKFKNEYEDERTSVERRKEIEEKSKKAGKIGWNIGVKERVIRDIPCWSEQSTGTGERELSYAHIRTGHLHAVRIGKGREHVKIMFYRPTVVRSDLPFKD